MLVPQFSHSSCSSKKSDHVFHSIKAMGLKKTNYKKATWYLNTAAGKKCGISMIHHSHLTMKQYLPHLLQKPQVLMSTEFFHWDSGLLRLLTPSQSGTVLCQETKLWVVIPTSEG